MNRFWDVAVVGAGPAGSASATLLARRGYEVVLLDRAHFPRPKACGEYLSPGVAQALREAGLEHAVRGMQLQPVPGMDIVSPQGRRFRIQYSLHGVPLGASTLQRDVLDAALVSQATQHDVQLEEGYVARGPILEDGVVRGVSGTQGGRRRDVRARLTVVADGSRSVLARALGLARAPRWPVRLGLMAHFDGVPQLADGFGQMHVADGGYCGIVSLPGGAINVATVVAADAVRRSGRSATEFFDRWIASRRPLAETLQGCSRASPVRGIAPIGARCRRAWAPGALLTGDAAGFFDPFTGEGIYRALRSAELVEQVADRALRCDDVSEAQLGVYDGLRAQSFLWKHATTALVQLFVQYPRLLEYALPRLARRDLPASTLSNALGDVTDARTFLNLRMLWCALRP